MNSSRTEAIHEALNHLRIETPSWGYADTGTRFGKFFQPAAAIDLNDKFADAGEVNRLTGCCPWWQCMSSGFSHRRYGGGNGEAGAGQRRSRRFY